ncbi:MAG: DUF4150 domain-containing protein [Thiolinea sp.]
MANEVFANGREISCKSGDGKSICEFPDVCMTPPTTPATPMGVPIPYPNTAFSRDATEGSRTVKIDQKEVMLQDASYYKTSTGDEAGCATPAKKGIISGTIKGKMYFIAWSMDVSIEGKHVARTADMTTHNHASKPGTGSVPTGDIEGAVPKQSPHECAHEYEIRNPKTESSAEEKKDRLRKSKNEGDNFEAFGAQHNNVNNGNDMSGANETSKLYIYCKKCNLRIAEVDHILRDSEGKITTMVECKSGGVKNSQMDLQKGYAENMKIKLLYKIKNGKKSGKTSEITSQNGINNIVI